MKKVFLMFGIVFMLVNCALATTTLNVSKNVYDNSHMELKVMNSYLSLDVPYIPVANIYKQILSIDTRNKLRNRGEAHITVITPVEYSTTLRRFVTMKDIRAIAAQVDVQRLRYDIVCLGRGQAHNDVVYFLVVKSRDLVEIREKILDLFVKKGGNPRLFDPENFYPHITVGFTQNDLHEKDGVIKDNKSCVSEIRIVN